MAPSYRHPVRWQQRVLPISPQAGQRIPHRPKIASQGGLYPMSKTKGQLRDTHNDLVLDLSKLREQNATLRDAIAAYLVEYDADPVVVYSLRRALDKLRAAIKGAKSA